VSYSGADGLDITVKSGKGIGKLFAPTWDMVMGVKQGRITEAEYTERFLNLLRERYRQDERAFVEVLKREQIVLLCYCRAGAFCHRHLVVDVLEKVAKAKGLPFERGGEV
jgi:uncharacterized protein YeaO (DUF488 family)